MAIPIAQAKRCDVRLMPNPTVRLAAMLTTPAGILSNADCRLLNPMPLIKVVEYVPVSPVDIAVYCRHVSDCESKGVLGTDHRKPKEEHPDLNICRGFQEFLWVNLAVCYTSHVDTYVIQQRYLLSVVQESCTHGAVWKINPTADANDQSHDAKGNKHKLPAMHRVVFRNSLE
jgi:hypothetical protein